MFGNTTKCAIINAACPKTADPAQPRFCPYWWSLTWQEVSTGEVKVTDGCGIPQLPTLLTEVIKSANRPAAEVGQLRNEVLVQHNRIQTAVQQFIATASRALIGPVKP